MKRASWSHELGGKPFLSFDVGSSPDLDAALARIVLAEEPRLVAELDHVEAAGIQRGTTSTWKQHNVLAWPHAACAELARIIGRCVRAYVEQFAVARPPRWIQCWCNVLRAGQQLDCHDHGCDITGVYYPQGIESESDGGLTCYSPDQASTQWLEVRPRRGMLNLFDGSLMHFVTEYRGPAPRISIAFDVVVEKAQGYYLIPLDGADAGAGAEMRRSG